MAGLCGGYKRHYAQRSAEGTLYIYTPGSDEHGLRFNRGSGGGARGCDFEERVGAHARPGFGGSL